LKLFTKLISTDSTRSAGYVTTAIWKVQRTGVNRRMDRKS
jgi:hypothetical protein